MLLIYLNKDNIHYAYYNLYKLPRYLNFTPNKRGQVLLMAIIIYNNNFYVVGSNEDLLNIYKTPFLGRIKSYLSYKNDKIRYSISNSLIKLANCVYKK